MADEKLHTCTFTGTTFDGRANPCAACAEMGRKGERLVAPTHCTICHGLTHYEGRPLPPCPRTR